MKVHWLGKKTAAVTIMKSIFSNNIKTLLEKKNWESLKNFQLIAPIPPRHYRVEWLTFGQAYSSWGFWRLPKMFYLQHLVLPNGLWGRQLTLLRMLWLEHQWYGAKARNKEIVFFLEDFLIVKRLSPQIDINSAAGKLFWLSACCWFTILPMSNLEEKKVPHFLL